jgi:hypothetical protein
MEAPSNVPVTLDHAGELAFSPPQASSTPLPAPQDPSPAESPQTVVSQSELAVEAPAAAEPNRVDEELEPLFNVANPRQLAPIAPPVGERIRFDLSVKETPPLPTEAPEASPPQPAPAPPAPPAIVPPPTRERTTPRVLPQVATVFPYPTGLDEDLRSLRGHARCQEWAQRVIDLLGQIHQSPSMSTPPTKSLLDQLGAASQQAYQLAETIEDLPLRAAVLRAGYATQRRSDIWRQVQRIVASGQDAPAPVEPGSISAPLVAVEQRLAASGHSAAWRKYLLLDDVKSLARGGDISARRELAKRVIKRIESPQLTEGQAAVFRNPPFDAFARELHRWSADPVDYHQLIDDVERYEQSLSSTDAERVARSFDALRWSSHEEVKALANLMNTHYRNSNVRVALSSELLNRLLPEPEQLQEQIADNIQGADVYGTSRVVNQLRVVLVPDGNNWRIGLEAHGHVDSETAASKGPATFYNQGHARFYARKLLLIDRRGIRVWRAEAVADAHNQLKGFETDFDAIPLVGWLARNMARQQHDERYFDAKAETEAKLEHRATSRFDAEVDQRLSEAESQLNRKLIAPFDKIALKPTPLDLRTTDQRVIARYRLASDVQVGAHTPRPQAPQDSLLSIQLHESALNNTLANLKLEGRRTDLRTLYRELADTFERQDLAVPDDIPENVVIQFADQDAVRVQFQDDRVALTIRFRELKQKRSRWTNFAVRLYYVADANQLNANLVRDDIIELSGPSLGLGDRAPLRFIFNTVFDQRHTFRIINDKLAENRQLDDSHVNQFVIDDGWIGIAIGPHYANELEHLATEPRPKR